MAKSKAVTRRGETLEDVMPKVVVHSVIRRWDQYVPIAVDSVIHQSYKNWELYIFTGDGSHEKLEEYTKDYPNIFLIKDYPFRDNGYRFCDSFLMVAGKGDYICTVDGDDALDLEFMEIALRFSLLHDLDVCSVEVDGVDTEGNFKKKIKEIPDDYCIDRPNFSKYFPNIALSFWQVWGKISKCSLYIEDLYVNTPTLGTFFDVCVSYPSLKNAQRTGATKVTGYYYRLNPEGATYSFDDGREDEPIFMYEMMFEVVSHIPRGNLPSVQQYILKQHRITIRHVLRILILSSRDFQDKLEKFHYMSTYEGTKAAFREEDPDHLATDILGMLIRLVEQHQAPLTELQSQQFFEIFCALSPNTLLTQAHVKVLVDTPTLFAAYLTKKEALLHVLAKRVQESPRAVIDYGELLYALAKEEDHTDYMRLSVDVRVELLKNMGQ